jgi:hypothetical protein
MYVDSQDFGLSPHLMLDGYWEMWVTEALVSLVRPGMVVADIGAIWAIMLCCLPIWWAMPVWSMPLNLTLAWLVCLTAAFP